MQALEPVPSLAPFVVEMMSKAFGRLPDPVLLPWLPKLITTLREQARELVPVLVREAGRTFPASLAGVDAWVPPWSDRPQPQEERPAAAPVSGPVTDLVAAHPAACDAVAALLGCDPGWPARAGGPEGFALPAEYPETATAVARLLALA